MLLFISSVAYTQRYGVGCGVLHSLLHTHKGVMWSVVVYTQRVVCGGVLCGSIASVQQRVLQSVAMDYCGQQCISSHTIKKVYVQII